MIYVYEHWRPDRNVCFYVGKGRIKRLRYRKRNEFHDNIVKKLSRLGLEFEVRIVASCSTDEEAFRLEIERIAYWRGQGVRLANLTAGGDGPHSPTEEVREKIREARSRQVITKEQRRRHREIMASPEVRAKLSAAAKARAMNSFKGKTHSAETRQSWSEKRRGKRLSPQHCAAISAALTENNHFRGKKHTPETRALISAANRRRGRNAIPERL